MLPKFRFFRIQVDPDELTNAFYDFVTDPLPSRNEHPVIQDLNDLMPEVVDILECMVLDGVEERGDVAAYVRAVFAEPVA